MKILIININSHTGSIGKISYGLLRFLKNNDCDCKIACNGSREEYIDDENIIRLNHKIQNYYSAIMTRITGYEGIFNKHATKKLIYYIENFKPDIIQLYNLHGYYINHYKLLEYIKKNNILTVYSMLDEFPYLGKCAFSFGCEKYKIECNNCPKVKEYPKSAFFDRSRYLFRRKKNIYKGWSNIVFTGPKWVCQQASSSALLKNSNIVNLEEPIDTKLFHPRDTDILRHQLGIPHKNKIVLTVCPAKQERKGCKYFVELARRFEKNKNVSFVFVGYNRDDWELPSNLIPISFVKSQDLLSQYYSLADLFICDSTEDTTPTSCMEALSCGTPIAGFDVNATPFIAPKGLGTYTKLYDIESQAEVVESTPIKDATTINKCREFALKTYSMHNIYKQQFELYISLLNQ
jgi:glycosyltransferase involved in cell wall biosynthesis